MRRRYVSLDHLAVLIGMGLIAVGVWVPWFTERSGPVEPPPHGNLPGMATGIDFLEWFILGLALVSLGVAWIRWERWPSVVLVACAVTIVGLTAGWTALLAGRYGSPAIGRTVEIAAGVPLTIGGGLVLVLAGGLRWRRVSRRRKWRG